MTRAGWTSIHPGRSITSSLTLLCLSEHAMLHLGFAIGLGKASDDLVRTALASEF